MPDVDVDWRKEYDNLTTCSKQLCQIAGEAAMNEQPLLVDGRDPHASEENCTDWASEIEKTYRIKWDMILTWYAKEMQFRFAVCRTGVYRNDYKSRCQSDAHR